MNHLNIHAYEEIPLCTAGLVMGGVLLVLYLYACLRPEKTKRALAAAHDATKAGQFLLGIDFLWTALLLFDSDANPLRMELFMFEPLRGILLLLCPVFCLVLGTMCKELLFPRALGLFLLLLAIVPMTAAFLKDPVTRLLIPIWWYPALTAAMFWVAKPYLFRDWMGWFTRRPVLYAVTVWSGLAYSVAIIVCAVLFW